jgi:hypothetical protein
MKEFRILLILLLVFFSKLIRAQSNRVFFNIVDFGAIGKDTLPDTDAINKATDAAAASEEELFIFPRENITHYYDQVEE